jgi:hypothetical protein
VDGGGDDEGGGAALYVPPIRTIDEFTTHHGAIVSLDLTCPSDLEGRPQNASDGVIFPGSATAPAPSVGAGAATGPRRFRGNELYLISSGADQHACLWSLGGPLIGTFGLDRWYSSSSSTWAGTLDPPDEGRAFRPKTGRKALLAYRPRNSYAMNSYVAALKQSMMHRQPSSKAQGDQYNRVVKQHPAVDGKKMVEAMVEDQPRTYVRLSLRAHAPGAPTPSMVRPWGSIFRPGVAGVGVGGRHGALQQQQQRGHGQ